MGWGMPTWTKCSGSYQDVTIVITRPIAAIRTPRAGYFRFAIAGQDSGCVWRSRLTLSVSDTPAMAMNRDAIPLGKTVQYSQVSVGTITDRPRYFSV